MSQELLYTSAPAGLNPGDQGFCTVLCTQGMPRNLKEFLESLSGYRQADQPPHPVNFSHLIHTIGGKRYQVLSRVGDYEKDYSGRTNKLAHHVALTMEEMPPAGPAALLSTSLWKTSWDGQPRWEPQGPILPPATAYQGPCRHWEALTGDAGWAGLLAESAADDSHRPMYVIFSPGQDVLPLVSEALGILPREKAWATSFSTYFTKLPAGVDCLWRFVLDGSPEAKQARSASHARMIDLVELQKIRRPAPAGNPYVEAARAGRVMESLAPAMSAGMGTFSPSTLTPLPTAAAATVPTESAPPTSPFSGPATAPASPFGKRFGEPQKSSKLPWILGGSALVLVLGVGALVYFLLTKDIPPTLIASDSSKPRERKTRPIPQVSEDEFLSPQEKARREAAAKRAAEKKTEQVAAVAPTPQKTETIKPPPETKEEKPKVEWDRTLKTLEGYLVLPPRVQIPGQLTFEVKHLTEIHAEDPKQIDLAIHSSKGSTREVGSEDSDTKGLIIRTEDEELDEGRQSRKWIVQRKTIDPFSKDLKFPELARFELAEQNFTFLWNMEAPEWAKANSLQYCMLEISHKDQAHRFRLALPKPAPREPYNLAGRDHKVNLAVNPNAVEDPDQLVLDLQLAGVDKTPFSKNGMRVGDKVKFATRNPAIKVGDPQIEFEVQFAYDSGGGPYLILNAITSRRHLRPFNKPETVAIQTVPIQKIQGPTILTDFAKIKKAANDNLAKMRRSDQYKEADSDFPKYNQQLTSLRSKVQTEGDPKKRKDMEGEISRLEKIVNDIKEVFKRYSASEDIITWAEEMETHFGELAKSARVGYSLYITIDGEKVYLARTELEQSPPEKDEPKKKDDSKKKAELKRDADPKPKPSGEKK